MKRTVLIVLFILTSLSCVAVHGQQNKEDNRVRTRERLGQLLEKVGPDLKVAFSQSQKQPFNYVGLLKAGLVNAESFEIVISVTANDTIGFRIYPHYRNGYINVDKLQNRDALMRLLLRLSDSAFLFWGADDAGDVFTGYTFTLESGFPEESIKVVLNSIANSDKFIGEMRTLLDAPIEDVSVIKPTSPRAQPAKVRTAKIRSTKTRSSRVRSSKARSSKIRPAKVRGAHRSRKTRRGRRRR